LGSSYPWYLKGKPERAVWLEVKRVLAGKLLNAPQGALGLVVHGRAKQGFASTGPGGEAKRVYYNTAQIAQYLIKNGIKPDQDVYLYSCEAAAGGLESNSQKVANFLNTLLKLQGGYKGRVWGPTTRIWAKVSSDGKETGGVYTELRFKDGQFYPETGEWIPKVAQK
jgi:hypothetical protein